MNLPVLRPFRSPSGSHRRTGGSNKNGSVAWTIVATAVAAALDVAQGWLFSLTLPVEEFVACYCAALADYGSGPQPASADSPAELDA